VPSRVTGLELSEDARTFTAVMPSGRNRWFIIGALVFGVPWLVGYVVLAVVIFTRAGDPWRGTLIVAMLTLLTVLVDVVAGASIWAALYALGGRETLTADEERVTLRRTAAAVSIPFRANRGILDRVEPLSEPSAGRNVPHPRLEFRGAHTRLRFGAGLTAEEAEVLELALSGYLERTSRTSGRPTPSDEEAV